MRVIGDLEKNAVTMLIATSGANVGNYLFHIYMGRHLGPSDYGILYSLVALLMIVSVPATTIQTVMTKYTAHLKTQNGYGKISALFFGSLKRVSLYGMFGFLFFTLASGQITKYLRIPSRIPVIIVGVILLLLVILPVGRGVLQGLQKFTDLGLNLLSEVGLKLSCGIVLVYLGCRVNGALTGFVSGALLGLVLVFIPLRFLFHQKKVNDPVDFKEIYKYSSRVILAFLCFMILTNVDVLLVKHFFKPVEAGYYSAAALIGKAILFLPGAIAMVMFPKSSELYAQNRDSFPVLKRSLFYVCLIAGAAAIICLLFPSVVVWLFLGTKYRASAPLVGRFAIAMTLFGLTNILFLHGLSIHKFGFLYLLGMFTMAQIIAIILFHSNLSQVIWIVVLNGLLLFIVNLLLYSSRWSTPKAGQNGQNITETR